MKKFTPEQRAEWLKTVPRKAGSANVAIISDKQRILMVKARYKDEWTFPGGVIDPNESPLAAALREVHEETGLELGNYNAELFTTFYMHAHPDDKQRIERYVFTFIARGIREEATLHVPNAEIAAAEWVDLEQISEYAGQRKDYRAVQQNLLDPVNALNYIEVDTSY